MIGMKAVSSLHKTQVHIAHTAFSVCSVVTFFAGAKFAPFPLISLFYSVISKSIPTSQANQKYNSDATGGILCFKVWLQNKKV